MSLRFRRIWRRVASMRRFAMVMAALAGVAEPLQLFPVVFMPLCAPALKDAAKDLASPGGGAARVPLLGRPDWWALWCRRSAQARTSDDFGTQLAAEHLDIAAAVAGHGVAIGSPILFRNEIAAGAARAAHALRAQQPLVLARVPGRAPRQPKDREVSRLVVR